MISPKEALRRIIHLASSPWDQQPGPQSKSEWEKGYYQGKQVGFEIAAVFARQGLKQHE